MGDFLERATAWILRRPQITVNRPWTVEELEKILPDAFHEAKYPLIAAPFFGATVIVRVRELNQIQIADIGDFSLIETFKDKVRAKEMTSRRKFSEIVEYAERTHEICKAALMSPTYEQIFQELGTDPEIDNRRKQLDELENRIDECPDGKEKTDLQNRIDRMRIWIDLLLPEDFLSWVVNRALGLERSDIKLVTEEILLRAAALAERGHDNPHDHIGGRFSDFNKDDIDARAWQLWSDLVKKKRQEMRAKAKGGKEIAFG